MKPLFPNFVFLLSVSGEAWNIKGDTTSSVPVAPVSGDGEYCLIYWQTFKWRCHRGIKHTISLIWRSKVCGEMGLEDKLIPVSKSIWNIFQIYIFLTNFVDTFRYGFQLLCSKTILFFVSTFPKVVSILIFELSETTVHWVSFAHRCLQMC